MNNTRRWTAYWTDERGVPRTYTFDSPTSRAVASVDFRLKLLQDGQPVPSRFELEEGTQVLPALKPTVLRGLR